MCTIHGAKDDLLHVSVHVRRTSIGGASLEACVCVCVSCGIYTGVTRGKSTCGLLRYVCGIVGKARHSVLEMRTLYVS
jgi:hypothetical protein